MAIANMNDRNRDHLNMVRKSVNEYVKNQGGLDAMAFDDTPFKDLTPHVQADMILAVARAFSQDDEHPELNSFVAHPIISRNIQTPIEFMVGISSSDNYRQYINLDPTKFDERLVVTLRRSEQMTIDPDAAGMSALVAIGLYIVEVGSHL